MILSSADILRILGGSLVIRMSAKLQIVDKKPAISGREGLFIYIKRYPELAEFEAKFTLWMESDGSEPDDIVLAELKKLLPKVEVQSGLMATITTTEFRSENTQEAPAETPAVQADFSAFEERFQALAEDIQDQMLLVTSGRPGRDGEDGKDGRDGRDGQDIDTTQTDLEDLRNVEQGLAYEKGQVLTWDGKKWTNLFIPQVLSSITGGRESVSDVVGATIEWKFHVTPSEEEPHTGDFHTDSTDGELATLLHVSDYSNKGNNVEVLLRDLLAQGYDRVYVSLVEDPSQAHLYSITSSVETVSGFQLNVTHVETAGAEPDFISPKVYQFHFIKSSTGGGGGGLTIDDVRLDAENQTFGYTGDDLTSVTGVEVQIAITYNGDGSVNTVSKTSNGTTVVKTFGYDANGNLISTTIS